MQPRLTSGFPIKSESIRRIVSTKTRFARPSPLMMDAAAGMNIKGYSQQDATDILNEIVSLQRTGVLDDGPTRVRNSYRMFNEAIDRMEAAGNQVRAREIELQLMKAEDTYYQTPARAGC